MWENIQQKKKYFSPNRVYFKRAATAERDTPQGARHNRSGERLTEQTQDLYMRVAKKSLINVKKYKIKKIS